MAGGAYRPMDVIGDEMMREVCVITVSKFDCLPGSEFLKLIVPSNNALIKVMPEFS